MKNWRLRMGNRHRPSYEFMNKSIHPVKAMNPHSVPYTKQTLP